MKRIIYLFLLSLGILFSCRENTKEKNIDSKTISVSEEDKNHANDTDHKIKVISSDFAKILQLQNIKSDTIYITNYWATWCPPCVKEIPDFVELQEEYKDKKVKFMFVSVDKADTQPQINSFIKKNNMKNVYRISMEDFVSNIGLINSELVGGIPVTIIQKGNVREGFLGDRSKEFMTTKIIEYLNK